MNLGSLIDISRRYGADPEFVLAGGGNTSLKEEQVIAVKASGVPLADIDESGFVLLSLPKLKSLFTAVLPSDSEAREKAVLERLLAARLSGQVRRPSVETLLHALFPYRFVVHLHPALVNGLMCSRQALIAGESLFGRNAMVLPYITPGYTLAEAVHRALEQRAASGDEAPHVLFLQNHGVFVAADSADEIDELYAWIVKTIRERVEPLPSVEPIDPLASASSESDLVSSLKAVSEKYNVRFFVTSNSLLRSFLASPEAFEPLTQPFTPDHIVYAGSWPLFIPHSDARSSGALMALIRQFQTEHGELPKIAAIGNFGIVGLGQEESAARRACELFIDAAKIAWFARSFGGVHPMQPCDIEFIRGWEVEKYRASVSRSS